MGQCSSIWLSNHRSREPVQFSCLTSLGIVESSLHLSLHSVSNGISCSSSFNSSNKCEYLLIQAINQLGPNSWILCCTARVDTRSCYLEDRIAYFHEKRTTTTKTKTKTKQTKTGLTRVTQDFLSSYLHKVCPQRI